MNYRRHIAYLRYVLRHKYYVWQACRIVGGIPIWRAIFHDWDKRGVAGAVLSLYK